MQKQTITKISGFEMDTYRRIFLVDDDTISHLIAERMFAKYSSCAVEAYVDPVVAINELKRRATEEMELFPDVILLDIDMPRMDGWEFLAEFQKLPARILQQCGVFMLSSSCHIGDVQRSRNFVAVKDFFSKPLTMEMVKTLALPTL